MTYSSYINEEARVEVIDRAASTVLEPRTDVGNSGATAAKINASEGVPPEGPAAVAALATHLDGPVTVLAYLLWAWRGWLPAAITANTAIGHFRAHAATMMAMRWNPVGNAPDLFEIATPPSLPAIESGWPAEKPVRHLVILLPDGAAQSAAAFRQLLRRKRLNRYRTVTIIVEGRAPLAAPIKRSVPSVRLLGIEELAAQMERAAALSKALEKMAAKTPLKPPARAT